MKSKDLIKAGIPPGPALKEARRAAARAGRAKLGRRVIAETMARVAAGPEDYREDPIFGALAALLLAEKEKEESRPPSFTPRREPAPWRKWGDQIEPQSIGQMERACNLPVAHRGALMPDAHLGYGLPIGGVLAVREAVIPYAVGVDIACRMKLTVLDLPTRVLTKEQDRLRRVLERETRFGLGATFRKRRRHPVLDEEWGVTEVTRGLKDRAWSQLGTSGSGNHFVEFGELETWDESLGLPAGRHTALLSHSGSRAAGNAVATHFSRLAARLRPELPRELRHLAWLDLDSEEGRDYWAAMSLMGRYAAANHQLIHRHIARGLGAEVLLDLENHHNFAWREVHDGKELVVHRKGATPAGQGVLGIIPGSMATPAYIVRGRGEPASLDSASHGAGRVMSRKRAKATFTWSEARRRLAAAGVTLISADLDEVPMVYKDIEKVMAAQRDLVEILARFHPRLVKMAPPGHRAED